MSRGAHEPGSARLAAMLLLASLAVCCAGQAAETSWYLLENTHFRMLTNAPERSARPILRDLEMYREAVTRVVNVRLPANTPRTPIILFKDRRRFEAYSGMGIAGFVTNDRRRGVIVMPSDTRFLSEASVVRHEYVHILALDMPLRYPRWYNEGIAEVLSLALVEPEAGVMTFGLANVRETHIARALKLFDERMFDGESKFRMRADPYWYFWLVTHYLTLGRPDLKPKLERYLVARDMGQAHYQAFERAFGLSLTDMWQKEVIPYTRSFPTFRIRLDFSGADVSFQRRPAPAEAVSAAFVMLGEERARARSRR